MKLAQIFSILLTSIFLSSCAPKDTPLAKPGGSNANANAESNKHLLYLIDRQAEAIHLFKAVIDSEYAQKQKLNVEDVVVAGMPMKKLSSPARDFKAGNQVHKSETNLLLQIEKADDQTVSGARFSENPEGPINRDTFEDGSKNITVKNKSKTITIKKLADGKYSAFMRHIDESNTVAGKSILINESQFTFSLVEARAEILEMTVKHNRYGSQTADLDMKSKSSSIKVDLKADCVSISGALQLESVMLRKDKTPVYDKSLDFTDSSVRGIANRDVIEQAAAECASRPVVDLKKLL